MHCHLLITAPAAAFAPAACGRARLQAFDFEADGRLRGIHRFSRAGELFKSAVRTKAWTASTSSVFMAFYPFKIDIINIAINAILQ
jgi:hypothetical protein